MLQLYVFIGALFLAILIIYRRDSIFQREKKTQFRKKISKKVDDMQKERHETHDDRFKDVYLEEQKNKKYDFPQYKVTIRKADMAMAKKQWSMAKQYLIRSMALVRDDFQVAMKLAEVYMKSDELKKAEELLKKLLEADQKNPAIYKNLAEIFTAKKRYREAVNAYVQAIEINGRDDKSLINLGKLYKLLMRHSLAAECFRAAAELKPREAEYMFLLAGACFDAEDFENALFTYERILTIEPYNEKALNAAQDVRIRMKETEEVMNF